MATDIRHTSPRSLFPAFCALVLCTLAWPALLTFDLGDWPSPHQFPNNAPASNACGPVGAWTAYQLQRLVGDGAYPLLLFATLTAFMRLVRGRIESFWERILGLALVVASTSAASQLISPPGSAPLPTGNGGIIGFALADLMLAHLSRLGTMIVVLSTFFVGLLFASDGWVLTLPALVKRAGAATAGAAAAARRAAATAVPASRLIPVAEGVSRAERSALLDAPPAEPKSNRTSRKSSPKPSRQDPSSKDATETEELDFGPRSDQQRSTEVPVVTLQPMSQPIDPVGPEASFPSSAIPTAGAVDAVEETESAKKKSKPTGRVEVSETLLKALGVADGPIVKFSNPQSVAAAEPYPKHIENWQLPSLTLLEDAEYGFSAQQESFVREQARILERTLEEFRLDARVVEIDTGPVITMFELKLGAGIKVSQIAMLSNDVARALRAHAVRVVAPISGKNTVGIEVPNLRKEKVRFKELLQLSGKTISEMALPLFLGKDSGGATLVADLTKMPHLLIAGTTGSGKSVCLNAIILSFLMTKRPDHVKLILIDPKMVEMSQFKEVPHLMCPLVTDMKQAEQILEWAVTKMDERYELLAETRVKNIGAYNELGAEELYARLNPANDQEKSRIAVFLPYIVVVIDELADLMMTSAKEVEHHLSRLAQKSRAVGIHIIVATQRPEVKVVTGLIKSNLPSRICFRVASRMDSRIVLDQNGGEVLMGQGDMLFLPPGSHKLTRAQGTYLGDSEVAAVLDDLSSRAKPEFHPELISLRQQELEGESGARDPLFEEAVRIILESRRGSVSLLQRRLTIGYSRASRLIDQMAAAGIVGDYKGSQAREVMMTLDDWERLRAQVAADLKADFEADRNESS